MFNPKETLKLAREAEKAGSSRLASQLYSKLATYFQRQGKIQAARSTFQHCVELTPKSPRLYAQLCRLDWDLGDSSLTSKNLKIFVKLCFEKESSEPYVRYFVSLSEDLPRLRQVLYQELLSVERNNEDYFLELARAFFEQSNLENAKKTLLDSIRAKHDPKRPLEMLKQIERTFEQHENLGYIQRFQKNEISLEDFLLLISTPRKAPEEGIRFREPLSSEDRSLHELIRALEKEVGLDLLEPRDSVGPLVSEFRRKASPLLSKDIQTRLDIALAFCEMGLTNEAQEELLAVQPEHELYLQAQCLLAHLFIEEGHDLKALEVLQRVLRDSRANTDILLMARYSLALLYFRLSDFEKAHGLVQEIELLNPEYRDLKSLKKQIEARLPKNEEVPA